MEAALPLGAPSTHQREENSKTEGLGGEPGWALVRGFWAGHGRFLTSQSPGPALGMLTLGDSGHRKRELEKITDPNWGTALVV